MNRNCKNQATGKAKEDGEKKKVESSLISSGKSRMECVAKWQSSSLTIFPQCLGNGLLHLAHR